MAWPGGKGGADRRGKPCYARAMKASRPAACCAILLAMFAMVEPIRAAQPASVSPARFARHPYTSALGAVWNYRSCGVHARAAPYRALEAAVAAAEAAARARGLGPLLERLRADYNALLAVSTMMPCVHGAAASLRDARRAVAAFQAWVAAQPPVAAQ